MVKPYGASYWFKNTSTALAPSTVRELQSAFISEICGFIAVVRLDQMFYGYMTL
jgi:hypothetical protein